MTILPPAYLCTGFGVAPRGSPPSDDLSVGIYNERGLVVEPLNLPFSQFYGKLGNAAWLAHVRKLNYELMFNASGQRDKNGGTPPQSNHVCLADDQGGLIRYEELTEAMAARDFDPG